MYKVLEKTFLQEIVVRMVIEAPEVARKRKAGQFVVLMIDDKGERIPLTIVDSDSDKGTITIIYQIVGKTTAQLAKMEKGEFIMHVLGPLGHPTEIENFGTAVVVGGGVGIGVAYPIAAALKKAGNKVISIIGARTKDILILEDDMRKVSDQLLVATDDGSYGFHGFVSTVLQNLIDSKKENIAIIYAIGPVPMMRVLANLTKPYGIKTIVSLNPIMVDATGMCGACRVAVAGQTRFTCVDGPEFDGHDVDFDLLTKRLRMYCEQETQSYEGHRCGWHGN